MRGREGHREGEKGGWRWGKREIIYLSPHCRHQNDSCIKMGSKENHFNVSLIVRDKVTRLSTNHNLFEEKAEPTRNGAEALKCAYQPNALPLGLAKSW